MNSTVHIAPEFQHSLRIENINLVLSLFERIHNDYDKSGTVINDDKADWAKHHFSLTSRRLKGWRKSKCCIVPGCQSKSIRKSHTIPKAMSLDCISDNGEVLTPEWDEQEGRLALKCIGVSKASTFPGFCQRHERLFEAFEARKKIQTENQGHIFLQIYRAACRELFRTRFVIEQTRYMVSYFSALRDERLLMRLKERMSENGLCPDMCTSISFEEDGRMQYAGDMIQIVQELSTYLGTKLIPAIEAAVFRGDDSKVFVNVVDFDIQMPVALSGAATFYVKCDGQDRGVNQILSVLPNDGHTLLIFAGHNSDKKYIEAYVTTWTQNVSLALPMVESWMVNGTDQWYLKPAVWCRINASRKKRILDDIFGSKQNIYNEYNLSIFDDIRLSMLKILKAKEEPTEDQAYWDYVNRELHKMD